MLRGLLANQSLNSSGATSTLESASLTGASSTGATINGAANELLNNATNNANSPSATSAATGSATNSTTGRPFSIIADETQNAIIVNAAPELMFEIEEAVNQLDNRRAQVLIQAAIVEYPAMMQRNWAYSGRLVMPIALGSSTSTTLGLARLPWRQRR